MATPPLAIHNLKSTLPKPIPYNSDISNFGGGSHGTLPKVSRRLNVRKKTYRFQKHAVDFCQILLKFAGPPLKCFRLSSEALMIRDPLSSTV